MSIASGITSLIIDNTPGYATIKASNALAHALVQLARSTGDRERDLPDTIKGNVMKWLNNIPNSSQYKELINNHESALGKKEQDWIFGEALPPGLVISSDS